MPDALATLHTASVIRSLGVNRVPGPASLRPVNLRCGRACEVHVVSCPSDAIGSSSKVSNGFRRSMNWQMMLQFGRNSANHVDAGSRFASLNRHLRSSEIESPLRCQKRVKCSRYADETRVFLVTNSASILYFCWRFVTRRFGHILGSRRLNRACSIHPLSHRSHRNAQATTCSGWLTGCSNDVKQKSRSSQVGIGIIHRPKITETRSRQTSDLAEQRVDWLA
jgi:hypothetical protein